MYGTFDLDVECAEKAAVALAALAGPRPAANGVRDLRTVGQRNHDALLDLLDAVLRAEQLPDTNGVTSTVVVTVPADQLQTGEGVVTTGTGAQVATAEALRWARGNSRWFTAVLDRALHGATRLASYGSACRLFTETQRLALIARDKGCSMPGCDAPPWLCQAHHVTDYARGRPDQPRQRHPAVRLPPPRIRAARLDLHLPRRGAALDRSRVARSVAAPYSQHRARSALTHS